MRVSICALTVLAGAAVTSTACGILGGTPQTAPTPQPTPASQTTSATPTSETQPTAAEATATQSFIPPTKGDIVFVDSGQLWDISPTGGDKRQLTSLPDGANISSLALSPNGNYAGYVINGTLAEVLDLATGNRTTVDFANKDRFNNIVWSADGSAIFYHKLLVDDSSNPVGSEVWKVAIPTGSAPERVYQSDLTNGQMTVPFVSLDGGLLMLHQFGPGTAGAGDWFTFDPATTTSTPVTVGFGIWDAKFGSQLLFNKDQLVPGRLSVPIALYLASNGGDPISISPLDDDQAAYTQAQFGPSSTQVAVIRYTQDSSGAVTSGAALLQAGQDGTYQLTLLAADTGATDVSLRWADEGHVVVQRLRGDGSELWLMPVDGTAGVLLANGEQPQVVGG